LKSLSIGALPTFVVDSREEAERALAEEVAAILRAKPEAVLGLATGNTPIGVYREWIRMRRTGELCFARATTFNLDEYLDLPVGHPESFREWMQRSLFAHIDLSRERAHLPEARVEQPEAREVAAQADVRTRNAVPADRDQSESRVAARYEALIQSAGGLDLQILGIGRNGHIGFNEPGSPRESRTRVVELHPATREDAANVFGGLEQVPKRAITMGVATICAARRIRVLAFGARKSAIVRRTLLEEVGSACPSTFLRGHADVKLYVDREAARELSA
jgi:glucosamine-6-phosphate deaminase